MWSTRAEDYSDNVRLACAADDDRFGPVPLCKGKTFAVGMGSPNRGIDTFTEPSHLRTYCFALK